MTKKILFVTLAIALAFGMMVSGCKEEDEEGFKDRTLNLTGSGNNSITLTVKGATWKDPTNILIQGYLLEKLLEWAPANGSNLENWLSMIITYSLTSDNNKLEISFTQQTVLGVPVTGSGTVRLQDLSTADLMASLKFVTDDMDLTPDWAIGTNELVTITIK